MNASAGKTRTILVSVAATLLVLALAGVGLMYSGAYDVAATDEHSGATRWVLRTTTVRSIKAHPEESLELPTDPEALQRGHAIFDTMCVQCHGAPGVEPTWLGQGMLPDPPDLRDADYYYTPAQLYWIIEHGLKFTGMPAMSPTHDAEEIREVTAFVIELRDMTAQEYQQFGRTKEKTASRENVEPPPEIR